MAKILVVDDDTDICTLFQLYLKKDGHEVTPVHSGEEALQRLLMNKFDLVITDILMPGLNGIELTRKLIDLYPDLKIIVCSEGGTSDAREIVASIVLSKGVNVGAVQALMKPFSRIELNDVVSEALEGKNVKDKT